MAKATDCYKYRVKKDTKNYFEKDFLKLVNNAVFGKVIENVRKHRYIKLLSNEARRTYLFSKPSYHTAKVFSETALALDMKKKELNEKKESIISLFKVLTVNKFGH